MMSIAKYILQRNTLFSFNSFNSRNVLNTAICSLSKFSHKTNSSVVNIKSGPGLKDFLNTGNITNDNSIETATAIPYLNKNVWNGNGRKVFFEVYGCQMNVSDTEIVWSILKQNGFNKVTDITDSDVILVVTCAIREGAEDKIWNRLKHLVALKKNRSPKLGRLQIGILGCMAERLKNQLLEKEQNVDLVAGPDSYKDLPRLLSITENRQSAINVLLSLDETYADIVPVRLNQDGVTAFVSIMRGCDNMCSYCIVPFTRGRERSRPFDSIINEVKLLYKEGIKEITLLGQNVNSYRDLRSDSNKQETCATVNGFKTVYKTKIGGLRFSELLRRVAETVPEVRIRFTSPHPKDFQDNVLEVINQYPNICKNLHLPAQSGNSAVLERMRRGYTRESYLDLVQHIKHLIPNVTLSSDFICGFCGETDEEFADTLSLMEQVQYNVAYLFAYSMREKTTAHRRYLDDVSAEVKIDRLKQMVTVFRKNAAVLNAKYVGTTELILIENTSKRTATEMFGRIDGNIKVIVPSKEIPIFDANFKLGSIDKRVMKPGDFVCVKITESNSQVLKGEPLYHTSISQYYSYR